METVISHFVGGIYNNYIDDSFGGPDCLARSTFTFRLVINVAIVCMNIFIFFKFPGAAKTKNLIPKQKVKIINYRSPLRSNQFSESDSQYKSKIYNIEIILGIVNLFTYLITIYFKIRSKRLMFILNPCHTVCIFSAILCLSPKKHKLIYAFAINGMFGGILGLVFPATRGFELHLEIFFFFFEHSLPLATLVILHV